MRDLQTVDSAPRLLAAVRRVCRELRRVEGIS
jgi:hypothetical protein